MPESPPTPASSAPRAAGSFFPAAGERVLARFRLEALVGRGGHGVVWRAWDEVLADTVALKWIHPLLTGDPAALQELRAEARRCRRLTHPHIVRLYDFHHGEEGAALAMEWVDGRSLSAWRAERPCGVLEAAEIAAWLGGLGAALDYAHREARVVHRDLKPANVLLTKGGEARVVDFGVGCRLGETATRTTRMLAAGTLAYMGPQQVMGEEPAPADDIYALGATLYELVAGRPPFTGGDVTAQIRERAPTSPSEARRRTLAAAEGDAGAAGALPAAWDKVILACLAKRPEERPATAGEVAEALGGAMERRRTRDARRGRGNGAKVAGAATGAAVLLAAASVWWWLGGVGGTERKVASPASPAKPADTTSRRAVAGEVVALPGPWRVRGAMAEGLVAHLPLDGELQDEGGLLRRAVVRGTNWVSDRDGRANGALGLAGRGALELRLGDEFRLAPDTPFTLAAWVRPEAAADGRVFGLTPAAAGEMEVVLYFDRGRLNAGIGARGELRLAARAEWPDAGGVWRHVAVRFDGHALALVLDGRELSRVVWDRPTRPAERVRLFAGGGDEAGGGGMVGAIDDVRLYRRALGAEALASLALEAAAPAEAVSGANMLPWENDIGWGVTRLVAGGEEDWDAVVKADFGTEATVAEWGELTRAWARWPTLAMELAGWRPAASAFLRRGGEAVFWDRRHYNATRMDGVVQVGYLAHDALRGHELALGSWYDLRLPVVARAATGRLWTVERSGPVGVDSAEAPGVDGPVDAVVWRREAGGVARRRAVAARLTPESAAHGAELRLADAGGGEWRVAWRAVPGDEGAMALSLEGPAGTLPTPVRREVAWAAGEEPVLVAVAADGRLFATVLAMKAGRAELSAVVDGLGVMPGGMRAAELQTSSGVVNGVDWVECTGEGRR